MSFVPSIKASIILCANCGLALTCIPKHAVLGLSQEVRYLLQEWIERKVQDTENICKKCDHALNQSVEDNDRKRKIPHKKVCTGCGRSLLRHWSLKYKPDHPMAVEVMTWHPLQQAKDEIHVCNGCNQHLVKSIAKRNNPNGISDKKRQNNICNGVQCTSNIGLIHEKDNIIAETQNEESNDKIESADQKCDMQNTPKFKKDDRAARLSKRNEMLLETECSTDGIREESNKLILTNYKRVANTARKCLFRTCESKDSRRVPEHMRETLLTQYKIYAGIHTRICTYHIENGDLKMLLNHKLLNDFSAGDIEDAFNILKKPRDNPLDFDDVERMSNTLCQFFTGMTTKDFVQLHDSVTWNFSYSRKALAVLLMKVRSNDPFEKIGSLVGLSRNSATRYFNLASECLEQADCDKQKVRNTVEESNSDDQNHKSEDEELLNSAQIYSDEEQ